MDKNLLIAGSLQEISKYKFKSSQDDQYKMDDLFSGIKIDEKVGKVLDICEKKNIQIISYYDEEYPDLLKEISDPPIVLYRLGKPIQIGEKIAVVGTRHCSSYGEIMSKKLSGDLSKAGFGVVSGMAAGVDTEAHKGALRGYTIAVLGTAIDEVYPVRNKWLYDELIQKGTVISEYAPGTTGAAWRFPQRNRIIAGLSLGTVVVEGDYKSGSMITGKLALDYNREVFAVPGRATERLSRGPNWLIKQGAVVTESIDDILDSLGIGQTGELFKEVEPTLNEEQLSIYRVVQSNPEIHIDQLSEKVGKVIPELVGVLLELELEGHIEELSGKKYIIS